VESLAEVNISGKHAVSIFRGEVGWLLPTGPHGALSQKNIRNVHHCENRKAHKIQNTSLSNSFEIHLYLWQIFKFDMHLLQNCDKSVTHQIEKASVEC
jgi:hypothetical protein